MVAANVTDEDILGVIIEGEKSGLIHARRSKPGSNPSRPRIEAVETLSSHTSGAKPDRFFFPGQRKFKPGL